MSCSASILSDNKQLDCLQDDLRQACKRNLVHFRFRKGCTVLSYHHQSFHSILIIKPTRRTNFSNLRVFLE